MVALFGFQEETAFWDTFGMIYELIVEIDKSRKMGRGKSDAFYFCLSLPLLPFVPISTVALPRRSSICNNEIA